jgi:C4-dicarboxylate-specific signal transduction histidine kinase
LLKEDASATTGTGRILSASTIMAMALLKKFSNKIFQPFFTTKPTGQGTGLGLSLAYDLVKAHGGEIKVEATENDGSEFIILLPIYP